MSHKHKSNNKLPPSNRPILVIPLVVVFLGASTLTYGLLPYFDNDLFAFIVSYLIVSNAVAFVMYGVDKQLARSENRRVPEKYLLFFGLIGGSLGSIIAINQFRHKTKKASYTGKLGLILIAQTLLVLLLLYLISR